MDFFLIAMPYTLLDQEPFEDSFPECEKRGIGIILGAPYASRILAGGSDSLAKYGYAEAVESIRNRVRSIESVCRSYGVPLKAAALQFPLGHSIVASVIPGALSSGQVRENLEMLRFPVPAGFWSELRQEGLVHPRAPFP